MMVSVKIRVPTCCGLGLHLLHQPGALDDIGEAGVVLDIGGDGHLAAGLDALHQYRLQVRPGGVDRRRIPRGPGPDDQNPATVHLAHLVIPRLLIHKIETRSRPHKAGPPRRRASPISARRTGFAAGHSA